MARILITGSSDGLGLQAAKALISKGHTVHLHARNASRAATTRSACPGAASILEADLTSLPQIHALATSITALGPLDCIIHNAGLYLGPYRSCPEADSYPAVFAVNVLAPYLLTVLCPVPKRLVYISSDSHWGGSTDLADFGWKERESAGRWSAGSAYADTKIYNNMFALAFGRRWQARGLETHAVDPGWVPTKMGGRAASGSLKESERLYVMCAEGAGEADGRTGAFWEPHKKGPQTPKREALDEGAQEALLSKLEEVTGVKVPE